MNDFPYGNYFYPRRQSHSDYCSASFQTQPTNLEEKIKEIVHALSDHPVRRFLIDHENDDEKQLVLKHKTILGLPAAIIAEQIAARRKAKEKLPIYYHDTNIIYPPGINLEQSSSEHTARFKTTILENIKDAFNETGSQPMFKVGVDLTGGFGIDSFFLSKLFSQFHYVEPDINLSEIARHNHKQLGTITITHHTTTAENFLTKINSADMIYIDPSRRSETKKVFNFKDSEPDISSLQPKIFEKTNFVLIKASPLLDIKLGRQELSFVKKIFVIAVENDVKELLFLSQKDFADEPFIEAINIRKDRADSFVFLSSQENELAISYGDPKTFLYEPNAAIMKAGAFKSIAKKFGLEKIQSSTHLYTSSELVDGFPGRTFKIEARVKPNQNKLKSIFLDGKANVTTRNYPLTVEELKKKTGLKDGGDKYLIGFSGLKEKFLVAATRVK